MHILYNRLNVVSHFNNNLTMTCSIVLCLFELWRRNLSKQKVNNIYQTLPLVLIQTISIFADPHSLEFTSMFGPESKFRPTFEQLVRFDGVPLSHCESWSEKALPELRPSLQDVQISLASCRQAHIDLKESHYEFPYVTNSTVGKCIMFF